MVVGSLFGMACDPIYAIATAGHDVDSSDGIRHERDSRTGDGHTNASDYANKYRSVDFRHGNADGFI